MQEKKYKYIYPFAIIIFIILQPLLRICNFKFISTNLILPPLDILYSISGKVCDNTILNFSIIALVYGGCIFLPLIWSKPKNMKTIATIQSVIILIHIAWVVVFWYNFDFPVPN